MLGGPMEFNFRAFSLKDSGEESGLDGVILYY